MKEGDQQKSTDPPLPVKSRSERRAAKIATTKIAESTKILASSKIIATAGLEKATPKSTPPKSAPPKSAAKPRVKTLANSKATPPVKQPSPILPKIPLLVFDSAPAPLPNVLSLLASTTYESKPSVSVVTPNVKSSVEKEKEKTVPPAKRKSSSSIVRNTGSLLMECQSDDLSPVQWATYRKSENEYLEVLRKLARWKSRSEVEIVYLNEGGAIPLPPKFMSVTEAANLPLPKSSQLANHVEVVVESKPLQTSPIKKPASVIQLTPTLSNGPTVSQPTLLLTPHTPGVLFNEAKSQVTPPATGPQGSQVNVLKKDNNTQVRPVTKSYFETKYKAVLLKYPDLDVKLMPQKLVPHSVIVSKKEELDKAFKSLLNSGPLALEKWMLEKGLFGATRYCLFHSSVQMKLMYMSCLNDEYRKSGYKWWCPTCAVMVPVSQGSFFSKWRQSHNEVLRLIYHWACNTDIQKVIQEFAYNGEFVNSVFMALRSICNAQSVHWRLGGVSHSVEIAEMELGNCQDISNVTVYCAYDRHTRLVILGAAATKVVKSKLAVLFKTFISRDSTIVGDRVLAPYLPAYFRNSFVCSPSVGRSSNLNASSYLRDHVASVFQERLKHMKLFVIQAKLDELSWREKFGKNPQDAFSNILTHIKQAYVCSVVTTKGVNSLPITMASGLKVVDTSELQASVQAAALTTKPEAPSLASPPGKVEQSVPPSTECSDPVYVLEGETNEADLQTAVDVAQPVAVVENQDMEVTEEPVHHPDVKLSLVLSSPSEAPSIVPNESPKMHSPIPNTTPVVIIKGDEGEMTVLQGTLKKPKKPVCQEIKVSGSVPQFVIPLDTYYYATLDGSEMFKIKQEKKYKFKCPACKKIIEDNIKVMKHLHGHIEDLKQLNLDLSDLTQCKYCFRKFASPYAMQSHVEEVHVSEPQTPVCRICDKEFLKKSLLIRHMQVSHLPSEMPYSCYVCKYRTSFYRDVINHFHEVHGGTDQLQCQYCLQVFTIRFGQGVQEGVTYSFYRHLYKHQTKSHMRRCQTCCLSFLSFGELQEHRVNDHPSFKNKKGVKPVIVKNLSKAIMIMPSSTKKLYGKNNVNEKASRNDIDDRSAIELKCIECKTSLYRQNHFIQSMSCSMCRFITTCSRAFADHAINIHSVPPRAMPKPYRCLSSNLCCLCGFHTYFGDKMARHLSKCVKSWCYFDDDNSAFPSSDCGIVEIEQFDDEDLSNDDNITLASLRQNGDFPKDGEPMEVSQLEPASSSDNDDKHNMLNVLGLMRVPSSEGMHTYSRKPKTITGGIQIKEETTGNS